MYWILFIGTALISWLVSATFNSRMKKYSQVPLNSDMTGADVARKMLRDNGIDDVEVVHVGGNLTDHYNQIGRAHV